MRSNTFKWGRKRRQFDPGEWRRMEIKPQPFSNLKIKRGKPQSKRSILRGAETRCVRAPVTLPTVSLLARDDLP